MANDWDEEVLPSSPALLVFLARPSIGPSRAFLNLPFPLSESGIRGPDERRWSIMTPNWSKPWKLWSTPIVGAIPGLTHHFSPCFRGFGLIHSSSTRFSTPPRGGDGEYFFLYCVSRP